jgi:hypothetical protein
MHFIRASAFAALGRHVDAGREYGAAALAPTDADAWLSAHYEFAIARDSTDAATALLHAAEAAQRAVDSSHGTGVPALRLLGAALRLQHRCADAESTTARVIALQPSTKQSADDAGSGPIALWTETPPGERGFAVRVQNRGAHRVRIATLLFPTCENMREVCDAPVDPCLDLLPGAVGELWVSPLDPSRGFSLQPELGSIERR